jgi:ketosteroid isomerase-like protein
MQRPIIISLFLLISATLTHQQANRSEASPQQTSSIVENEVKEAIRQRLDALRRRDAKTYLTYYAEDCIVTSDNGVLVKPEAIAKEWSDSSRSGISYKGSAPLDVQVQGYGDIAVASFRLELDEDWGGQKLYGASRLTDVFARRGGRWLLVAHQETPVPNARRLAVKVNPALFDAYAGEYQITPSYIIKVKREGDKLMEQWPGDASYTEDIPVSESMFVARGEPGLSIYVKDRSGKVTHFISRTIAGDLIAKKTK